MKHPLYSLAVCTAALTILGGLATASPALAATLRPGTSPKALSVMHVGQIDQQDIASEGGCEPGTLVEPEVAVSPFNPNIQVAAAHDCRFATGGAVDISYAWTHDGGAHWQHAPLPGLTRHSGGVWARASDPAVAFGPDGSVYISSLVFDNGCPTGIAVSKSTDGGATFAPPSLVQQSKTCAYSDDKDWLVVDTQPTSPFYGRIYVFWTAFIPTGSPQVLRFSDNGGKTWSATQMVNPKTTNAQDSQPMIQPDGTLIDTYQDFGGGSAGGGKPIREHPGTTLTGHGAKQSGVAFMARTSFDGGMTWSKASMVTPSVGGGPAAIRCCLPAANVDPVTGKLYAVWEAAGPGTQDPVMLSSSADGRHWSAPVMVTSGDGPSIQHITGAVAAYGGKVYVAYGTLNTKVDQGNHVQQQLSTSTDGGATFGPPITLGPVSNLTYAAVAGGKFPGDYAGASATASRLTLAWCVSSKPANPNRVYHQTLYAAVLRT
ncbi:MAG TPA: sialidase family protein [Streptosporangiaceae bacterium]|nr:sialidase family protein [Streptosporangiaceae bacterium]